MPDLSELTGPAAVTLALLLVYYGFMIRQAVVKTRLAREHAARNEKFDRYYDQNREMLAADRTLLNLHEHLAPFLVLLWMHALWVSPTGATVAGGIYVAARIAYPLLLGARLGRSIPLRVVAATGTGYVVLAYFLFTIGLALLRG